MKIKVILNPKSKNGNHRSLRATLEDRFGDSLVDIERTAYPHHATGIARRAIVAGVDTIVAVGGDGTVNEVLNGIVGSDVALGIIPTGTANDLASLYHIDRDVDRACSIIVERRLHRADVIRVNEWHYVTAGGVGFPCEVAGIANTIKGSGAVGRRLGQILGSKLYVFALLWAVAKRNKRRNFMTVRWEGTHRLVTDSLWLMVDNQFFLGKDFLMSPSAVNDDGLFDVCLIENPMTRAQIILLTLRVLAGSHVDSPSARTWRASELVVEAEKPQSFLGDGEVVQKGSLLNVRLLPRALNVIVPGTALERETATSGQRSRRRIRC